MAHLHCNPTFSLLWNLYSCFFRYFLLKNTWKCATNRIVSLFVCICHVSAKITKQLRVKITCDTLMTVYSGRLQPEHSTKNVSANYTVTPGDEILAVRCRNFNSKPWILWVSPMEWLQILDGNVSVFQKMSTLTETHGLIPSSMITIGPRPSRGSQTGPGEKVQ